MTKPYVSDKIFGIMLLISWAAILSVKPLAEVWDDRPSQRPWINVDLSIEGEDVVYSRVIKRMMRGEWTSYVQLRFGDSWRSYCYGSGDWTYRPETTGEIRMSFLDFTGGCVQPTTEHRTCVEYMMTDMNNRRRPFGPFCSPSYNPRK
ncbi:MAG: hypothetical protein Tp138OMZ00d2C19078261_59 [Prokaryotic dsDNA virus sp.]|jgi:hypothetical protein|nr:MAG: hypothetical protein Tp138OMZ00d2C19078261_59 [Prokaryotic dsDNA virus sp.]|tara:strand:- start:4892 stop:5335 length:444 start_codon:yes stop_codon:yes gene_type:complete